MGCGGVKTVEGIDSIRRVGEISGGFPAIVADIIALPLHKILVLVTILMAVEDLFDLVLIIVVYLNRWWWLWVHSIDIVAMPWG